MNGKTYFNHPSGNEAMLIDCGNYEVQLTKNTDMEHYSNIIVFSDKKTKFTFPLVRAFVIDWDKPEMGGKLTIKYRDRWGCEMIFIHYDPTDIKGMFDFIAKGFDVFKGRPELFELTDYNTQEKPELK